MTRGRAVVFGPVQPVFDPGFFDPISAWLRAAGYAVELVDTLAVLEDDAMSVADVAAEWLRRRPELSESNLFCGNAFGGAVVQAMLPAVGPDAAVLTVSAPTIADASLAQRLGEVAELARHRRIDDALRTLDFYVRSHSVRSPSVEGAATRIDDIDNACRRIEMGMSMLTSIDLDTVVADHRGPMLAIVGQESRLVTTATVRVPEHGVIADIPRSGMRPHRDNWPAVARALAAHPIFADARDTNRHNIEGAA
ncbi:hypothetical protein BH92_06035 [Rhodococcoides fascians A21d2]|uniref:hypothetical protein n=1 Tax=Rhodococcoides fascians TaxID=1828 RepID=UPI00056551E7|nr:hypothetical protein [Rhodococcus fascians]QIH99482.1 hypothetical protein BH92_06035 [Rhodococcus fascians A21d2]